MNVLQVENLIRSYRKSVIKESEEDVKVLKGISFQVAEGEFVGIMGKSGCGKTTLLKTLGMIDKPTDGTIKFMGEDTSELYGDKLADIRNSKIGFIFQDFYLMDSLSVEENIMLPMIISKQNINKMIAEAKKYAEQFQIEHLLKKNPYELSGGEKQRVAICRALINNPDLILADEPTGNLDSKSGKIVIDALNKISSEYKKTIVMVTHTINNLDLCDKVIIMGYGGRLCYCGSPAGIKDFFHTDNLVKVYDIITADSKGWETQFKMSGINAVSGQVRESNGEAIKPRTVSGFAQLGILVRRYTTLIMNDVQRLALIFGQPLIIGLLLTLVARSGIYELFTETQSILFTLMSGGIWMGLLNTIQEVNKERVILKREYMGNLKLPIYMLSKYIVQGVISLIQAVILVLTFVLIKGAPDCKGVIFSSATVEIIVLIFLTIYAAAGMGLLLSSITKSADRAMAIAPFVLIVQLIFSGILFELNGVTDKLSYLTYSRWAMESIGSTCDLNSLDPPGQEESEQVEEQFDDLVATCNDAIAEMQEAYDEKINELQDAVETYSALANNPQTFEEYTSEPQTIEAEYEPAETEENKMYVRSKARTVRSWLILYGSTFLCAGVSVLVLRKLKDEQR